MSDSTIALTPCLYAGFLFNHSFRYEYETFVGVTVVFSSFLTDRRSLWLLSRLYLGICVIRITEYRRTASALRRGAVQL